MPTSMGVGALSTLAVAANDADASVREQAMRAIGEVGDISATAVLQPGLTDLVSRVRAAAIEAFAAIGGDASALRWR